jgi:hypothetical protein
VTQFASRGTGASEFLAVLGCAIPRRTAIYCSAPITSGERFTQWVHRSGHRLANLDEATTAQRDAHRVEVIEPNVKHASKVVERLRAHNSQIVIDPTAINHLAGWQQSDWLEFWLEVIRNYAKQVVFVDGWQFSSGCVQEYLAAINGHLPTYDERMQPISVASAVLLIRSAMKEIADRGIVASPTLEEVIARLEKN